MSNETVGYFTYIATFFVLYLIVMAVGQWLEIDDPQLTALSVVVVLMLAELLSRDR